MSTNGIRFRTSRVVGILMLLAVGCGGESQGPGNDSEATGGDGGARTGTDADAGADDGSGGTAPGAAGDSGDPGAGAGGTSASGGSGASAGAGQAGGVATGGASPVPPLPPFPPPMSMPQPVKGCEPVTESTGPDYCQIEHKCENGQYLFTYCRPDGTGALACNCQAPTFFQDYLVEGTAGLAACQLIGDVCAEGEAISFEDPPECSTQSKSTGPDYCERSDLCRRKVDLGNGVTAVLNESRGTTCFRDSPSSAFCQCSTSTAYRQYQLQASSLVGACDTLHSICTSGEGPVFEEEPECQIQHQSSGPDYCDVNELCTRTVEIGEGVIAIAPDSRWASCSAASGDAVRCECRGNESSLRFERAGTPVTETCVDTLQKCQEVDTLEVEGEPECRTRSQFADVGFCNASLECAMDATVGGDPVRVFGSVEVYCMPVEGGWSCTCSSSGSSSSLAIDISDPWDACSEATRRCPEVVDVQPSSDGAGTPLPPFPVPIF
ncbi:MAG: hypothetical protein DIU78_011175 [Pseudomonadota bacterium]